MKFWELISGFRDEKDVLEDVLNNPQWIIFKNWYACLNTIVKSQNRQILDSEIPAELSEEVILKSRKVYIYSESGWLRKSSQDALCEEDTEILTALEVYHIFGGQCIEEIEEYGSCYVGYA